MCTESYTPALNYTNTRSGVPSSPAKYVSPFGDSDPRPVVVANEGAFVTRTVHVGNNISNGDPHFTLPNTPDTEDTERRKATLVNGRSKNPAAIFQLLAHISGESHI